MELSHTALIAFALSIASITLFALGLSDSLYSVLAPGIAVIYWSDAPFLTLIQIVAPDKIPPEAVYRASTFETVGRNLNNQ